MNYKRFTAWFIGISISLMMCVCAALVIIDPLGMFNIVNIQGFNHYKGIQNRYIDVWKPYEIRDKKPDIIFIGSSRVGHVIDPRVYKADAVVYNAGFNGVSLKHLNQYINMIYSIKKPKKIYLGLDFFQFDEFSFSMNKNKYGFSSERINNIVNKDDIIFFYKLKDTLGIDKKHLYTVLKNSRQKENISSEHINGYYNYDNNINMHINKKAYYMALSQYTKSYKKWTYSNDAMECFQQIVNDAKKNNVELVVYFNPISIELLSLMEINNVYDDLERVKRKVTSICGVAYDFNFVNKDITNKKYFVDASHANRLYGNIIIRDLKNKKDSTNMLVLTRKNINNQLKKERKNFVEWKKKNSKYYASMEKKLKGNKKVKIGDFKEFIGF